MDSETARIIYNQTKETVKQDGDGVTLRLGVITCPCGWRRSILHMYQCLYCRVWFCENCAEVHFGKTREEYKHEHL